MIELLILGAGCFLAGTFVYKAGGPERRYEFLLAVLLVGFVILFAVDVKLQRDLLGPQLHAETINSINAGYDCYKSGSRYVPTYTQPKVNLTREFGINVSALPAGPGMGP